MPVFKTLGDRCKFYERNFGQGTYLFPQTPALCRLDGRSFHSFCKGLKRPYDERLSMLMIDLTKHLVAETSARFGYTQSDEITLCWLAEGDTQMFFDGKRQKIESITAAMATEFFNRHLPDRIPEKKGLSPLFDSRAWSVPNKNEAVANVVWRENDATKNSVTMAASTLYSHGFLQGKKTGEKQELLFQKGINWNDYPNFFKRGSYVLRKKETFYARPNTSFFSDLSEENKKFIFEKMNLMGEVPVTRTVTGVANLPKINSIENKIGVLFDGETVILKGPTSL